MDKLDNTPLVSCVIPSYKRSDTLARAIDSVLNQSYKNTEVLVVDDNILGDEYSNNLHEIIKKYEDEPRVKLVVQERHINGAEARNAGVRASSGDYIAFLDDDDEWMPDKIERQMNIMKADPDLGGVAGGATLWEGDREVSHLPKKTVTENNLLFNVLIRKVDFATSTFLCKKSAFESIGGFDINLVRSQDLQLFADFLAHHRIYPICNSRTTKMYIESRINQLDSKKLINNKEAFFSSISDVIGLFSKATQNRIKSAHYYEISLVAFREGCYMVGIKFLLKGFKSPRSILDLIERFYYR